MCIMNAHQTRTLYYSLYNYNLYKKFSKPIDIYRIMCYNEYRPTASAAGEN